MKSKLTKDEFEICLNRVLQGETYKQVAASVGYGVSFLSVKVRRLARDLNKEDLLDKALLLQKAKRNKSGVVKNFGKKYIQERLPYVKEWRQHPKLSGVFISDNGLVQQNGKLSTPSIKEKSLTKYASVTIFILGKRHYLQVHRLVLETYSPIQNSELFQVDHVDGNGLNNFISNLQWVVGSENIKRSFKNNPGIKLAISSQGGTKAGAQATEKAIKKYQELLQSRFISYNKAKHATVTYKCKCCNKELTEPITARAFRYGMNGVCGNCRRTYKKQVNQ